MKVPLLYGNGKNNPFYLWIGEDFPSISLFNYYWIPIILPKDAIETLVKGFAFSEIEKETELRINGEHPLDSYFIAEISDELLLTCEEVRIRKWAAKQLEKV